MELILKNARIVTPEGILEGSVLVRDGLIAAVDENPVRTGEDLEGDILMPGIVDLHTDSLEKHYFPRANIDWPPASAAVTHDACSLAVGVTTVFNSLSVGNYVNNARADDNLRRLVDGLLMARRAGMLKADHRIHWRCETTSRDLPAKLEHLADHPMTSLFSLMDHTPGQRQYRNLERHTRNWRANGMSEVEVAERLSDARERQVLFAAAHRRHVAALAAELGLPLASHDDEDPAHIDEAADLGATISEFPVTLEAARQARARGMTIFMGGPNLIRGGSYSGNVPASELAAEGLLDGFASDYVPRSLMECAFRMTEAPFAWPLQKAVDLVTAAPAAATGLTDRGRIVPGLRADLLRVRLIGGLPTLQGVWIGGLRSA